MALVSRSWSCVQSLAGSLRMQLSCVQQGAPLHGLSAFPFASKLTLHLSAQPADALERLLSQLAEPGMPAVTQLRLRQYCCGNDDAAAAGGPASAARAASTAHAPCGADEDPSLEPPSTRHSLQLSAAAVHALAKLRSLGITAFLQRALREPAEAPPTLPGPGMLPWIMRHIGLCSSLTALNLRYVHGAGRSASMDPVLQHVTHDALPALRVLSLSALNLLGDGVLPCLTRLTGLEQLRIYGRTLHARPQEMAALAGALTRLTLLKLFQTAEVRRPPPPTHTLSQPVQSWPAALWAGKDAAPGAVYATLRPAQGG